MISKVGVLKNIRQSWVILIAWLVAAFFIPVLSFFGRRLQKWTFENLGETAFAWILTLGLIGLAFSAIQWQSKNSVKTSSKYVISMGLLALIILFVVSISLPRTEERLHFITMGLFGFLSWRLFPGWLAILLVMAWSAGDELFQAWLPDRVGDWRDVGINVIAGCIGIGFALRRDDSKSYLVK